MHLGKWKINLLFILVLFLFGLAGMIREILMAWLALGIHEAAHLFVLRSQGGNYKTIELYPFGGVARLEGLLGPREEFWVALAGPAANLILVMLLKFPVFQVHPDWTNPLIEISMLMAGINLLPALPLDGGRVLRSFLAEKHGYRKATFWALKVSRILSVLAGIATLLLFFWGKMNFLSLFLAFFVYRSASREREELLVWKLIDFLQLNRRLNNGTIPGELWAARGSLRLDDLLLSLNPHRYQVVAVIDEEGNLRGWLDAGKLTEAVGQGKLGITLYMLLGEKDGE